MFKVPDHIKSFTLNSIGEITKQAWVGDFRIKCVLSHSDRFKIERIFSELLPPGTDASKKASTDAAVLSELAVRVIDGPQWWKNANNGLMMVDMQPLYDLIIECNKLSNQWSTELDKLATDVKETVIQP
jgi:hypothetical protein